MCCLRLLALLRGMIVKSVGPFWRYAGISEQQGTCHAFGSTRTVLRSTHMTQRVSSASATEEVLRGTSATCMWRRVAPRGTPHVSRGTAWHPTGATCQGRASSRSRRSACSHGGFHGGTGSATHRSATRIRSATCVPHETWDVPHGATWCHMHVALMPHIVSPVALYRHTSCLGQVPQVLRPLDPLGDADIGNKAGM